MSLDNNSWKYIAAVTAVLAVLAGVWFHGNVTGSQNVQALWTAAELKQAKAIEKQRAKDQAEADAKDKSIAEYIQNLLNEKERLTEGLNDAIARNNVYTKCVITDDVVRSHNAKISAGTR